MIDIDATATPFVGALLPAALACAPAGLTAWTAATAAPFCGTGLPVAGRFVPGSGAAVRVRPAIAADERQPYATGIATGLAVQPMTHRTTGTAVLGAPGKRTTPGDLPPEDPLS